MCVCVVSAEHEKHTCQGVLVLKGALHCSRVSGAAGARRSCVYTYGGETVASGIVRTFEQNGQNRIESNLQEIAQRLVDNQCTTHTCTHSMW